LKRSTTSFWWPAGSTRAEPCRSSQKEAKQWRIKLEAPSQHQLKAWRPYIEEANWTSLHTKDLERFAKFVRSSSRRNAPIDCRERVEAEIGSDTSGRLDALTLQLDDLYSFGRTMLDT